MKDPANTTPQMLLHAAEIARAAGLKYIYAGNIPGSVGGLEDTRCHNCSALLIERYGYYIRSYRLTAAGACPDCGTSIPGRWGTAFAGQIASSPFLPGTRRLLTL
jgi:pyruvate formate lyase activating enzyme